jgi:hypothetical protein
MRGSLWSLAVAAIFAGLLLRAVGGAMPASGASDVTLAVSGILAAGVGSMAGLLVLLLGIGALLSISVSRGF